MAKELAMDLVRLRKLPVLPVPWLLQYLIGRPGIPANSITEFIGQESVGKSSLVYALMGNFIANNIPCYYINSEPKALEGDWQARLVQHRSGESGSHQEYNRRTYDGC